jgi:molybdopterin-synthase adenylyltransferase
MTAENRYARQERFASLGAAGQQQIGAGCVAIVGCGALGNTQADLLARAGVGRLVLVDRDFVELTNLQRQVLFDERDAAEAMPKAIAAARRLAHVNSSVTVEAHAADLDSGNIAELLAGVTLVLDATDNFETRFLLNDYCVAHALPWIYGAAVGSYGITCPFLVGGPCLACLYPEPPSGDSPTCETDGVLNSVTTLIAALQVAGALQILSGNGKQVRRVITTVDVWKGPLREVAQPEADPQCRCCARRDFEYLRAERRAPLSLCGRNAVQVHERRHPLNLPELRARLEPLGEVRANEFALRFWHAPYEMTVFPDGRAIVKGTTDTGVARSLYSRFIGN